MRVTVESGNALARILTGAWRKHVEPLPLDAGGLEACVPLLLATGAAPLAWRRLFLNSQFEGAQALHDDHRWHAARAAFLEDSVNDFFGRMSASAVKGVLFKGWALARMYPDAGLRPYGDIDVWVRPEDLKKLYPALKAGQDRGYCVEPHLSFYPQFERSLDDVISRSQLLRLNDVEVCVPASEDHLRFICLHFLYHGGWRPLWLCDVALMVESAKTDFDWDRCLSGRRKHADWVLCVMGLAHQLLGADIAGTPAERRAKTLPRWLTNAVLRQWAQGTGMSFADSLSFSVPRRLLQPTALLQAVREHWRNPIQASVEMNAPVDGMPRALLQFASMFLRLPDFARYFGREVERT
jgi:hypothetical protein